MNNFVVLVVAELFCRCSAIYRFVVDKFVDDPAVRDLLFHTNIRPTVCGMVLNKQGVKIESEAVTVIINHEMIEINTDLCNLRYAHHCDWQPCSDVIALLTEYISQIAFHRTGSLSTMKNFQFVSFMFKGKYAEAYFKVNDKLSLINFESNVASIDNKAIDITVIDDHDYYLNQGIMLILPSTTDEITRTMKEDLMTRLTSLHASLQNVND